MELFLKMEETLRRLKGINGNIDGVSGALLLDLGFTKEVGRAVFFAGRLPGITSWIIRRPIRATSNAINCFSNPITCSRDFQNIVLNGDNKSKCCLL